MTKLALFLGMNGNGFNICNSMKGVKGGIGMLIYHSNMDKNYTKLNMKSKVKLTYYYY